MHDGYVYTFGICTTTSGPAATLLNTLLAALPPVKRAAFLSDFTADSAQLYAAEWHDAELVLLVVPLDRIADAAVGLWVEGIAAHLHEARAAALVIGIGDGDTAQLDALAATLAQRGCATACCVTPALHDTHDLVAAVQAAYAQARHSCAVAPLPTVWPTEEAA